MILQVVLKSDLTGHPRLDSLSYDHGRVADTITHALEQCRNQGLEPEFHISLVEVHLQRLVPPVSWVLLLTDGGGKLWETRFIRPEDRDALGTIQVPAEPVVRRSRYGREPVV